MFKLVTFITPFLFIPTFLTATTIYVDQNAVNGNHDGTSWNDAYTDLHNALTNAQPGDSIWVAQGRYYPTQGTDRSVYFELKDGVALFGGFTGTETLFSERDWQANPTIIDGDIGLQGDSTDNSHTLLYIGTSSDATIVDGLAFLNGNADETGFGNVFVPNRSGGALFIDGKDSFAYPKIRNCRSENNYAAYHGGAVLVYGFNGSVAPKFENCSFSQNKTGFDGGAIHKEGSSSVEVADDFIGCIFKNNEAGRHGGGVYFVETDRTDIIDFIGCEFIENKANNLGGGLLLFTGTSAGSKINVSGCDFLGNTSGDGAGMYVGISPLYLEVEYININSCTFEENASVRDILSIEAIGSFIVPSRTLIAGCTFNKNSGRLLSVVSIDFSTLKINDSNFTNNTNGHLFFFSSADSCQIKNCYITGNGQGMPTGSQLIRSTITKEIQILNSVIADNYLEERGFIKHSGGAHDLIVGCLIGNKTVSKPIMVTGIPDLEISIYNSIILEDDSLSNFNALIQDSVYLYNTLVTSFDCNDLPPEVICASGNIFNLDPMINDTAAGDYHLGPCSPARNAGDNAIADQSGLLTDLDGNQRIEEGAVDLGPYETPPFGVFLTSSTDAKCNGESSGTATIGEQSGCPPFSLSFGGASTFTDSLPFVLEGLPAGSFEVVVNDSEGRSEVLQVSIGQPPQLTVSPTATAVDCGSGTSGTATVTANGGTPFSGNGYLFEWTGGQTGDSVGNLSAGNYAVTAMDSFGCTASSTFSVAAIGQLSVGIDTTGISCHPANGESSDGSATAAPNGVPPYVWAWQDGQTSETSGMLVAGSYSVTVTDALGCTGAAATMLDTPDSIALTVDATPIVCQGLTDASATATAGGGTMPYAYQWATGENTAELSGIGSGIYNVTLTDANGCQAAGEVEVLENTTVQIDTLIVPATGPTAMDGTVTVQNVSGGIPPYSFLWDTGDTTASIENLPVGTYSLTLTDSLGCSQVFTFVLDFEVAALEAGKGEPNISIYPNPAGKGQPVSCALEKGFNPNAEYCLFDALGRQIREKQTINLNNGIFNFTAPSSPGIYWLVIEDGTGRKDYGKFVVQ